MPILGRGRATDTVDLRMLAPAAGAWAGAVVATRLPIWPALALTGGVLAGVAVTLRVVPAARVRTAWVSVGVVLALASVVLGVVRAQAHREGPVPRLAADRAAVRAVAVVTTDPHEVRSAFGSTVVFDATLRRLVSRGETWTLRAPVVVWVRGDEPRVRLGETIDLTGRLGSADDSAHAATVTVRAVRTHPGGDPAWWWDGAAHLRASISSAVAGRGPDVAALVPALVHGDDHALSDDLRDAFQTSGLTHLLAVSGTNLTLLVGFLLAVARPLGAGPRMRVVLAVVATLAYVLLARPEPSVVRAAVMGLVGVAGLSTGGRSRGVRGLAWAVVVVVLVDPWLATSAGFLLSALATGGILLLSPVWCDALARWMPTWLAEAVAVPAAAQLACTAPVAALSGQVSLVAVAANLLAAPAVGPATVLGLCGGLAGLVWAPLGSTIGLATALPAGWIVLVGRRTASAPGAAATVGNDTVTVALLVVASVAVALTAHRLWRRRAATCALGAAALVVVLVPFTPGWPPRDWVMVACDVGQGDATVIRAGPGAALVVDTGPDPVPVDRCLRDLGVREVPLVVLTHAHADHVDGLPGVLRRRHVAMLGIGPSHPDLPDMPVRALTPGERWTVGQLTLTVLGPLDGDGATSGAATGATGDAATTAPATTDDSEESANDASVVLLVEVGGIRVLLTGDVEPTAQGRLRAAYPDLRVDVLKVPHHGSAHQDPGWLTGLDARWATVSAGKDNSYGHPSPTTLRLLRDAGVTVLRTDPGRDVALVVEDGVIRGVVR